MTGSRTLPSGGRATEASLPDGAPNRTSAMYVLAVCVAVAASSLVVSWLAGRWSVPRPMQELIRLLALIVLFGVVLRRVMRRWEIHARAAAERERDAARREQEAVEQIHRATQVQTSFLTAVSHELRTPLTSIVGHATTLADLTGKRDQSDLHLLATRLVASSRRLETLVLDLLDCDALLRNVGRARPRLCDIGDVIRQVTDRIDLDGRTLMLAGCPTAVHVDVAKLERTVALLVDNAVRHTPPDTLVVIQWRLENDELLLIIDDDGPGLPPDLLPLVFKPFTQGRHAATVASPGLGIGLALAAENVRLHGGRIVASANPTGGARITIRLPQPPTDVPTRRPLSTTTTR